MFVIVCPSLSSRNIYTCTVPCMDTECGTMTQYGEGNFLRVGGQNYFRVPVKVRALEQRSR